MSKTLDEKIDEILLEIRNQAIMWDKIDIIPARTALKQAVGESLIKEQAIVFENENESDDYVRGQIDLLTDIKKGLGV